MIEIEFALSILFNIINLIIFMFDDPYEFPIYNFQPSVVDWNVYIFLKYQGLAFKVKQVKSNKLFRLT